MTLKEAASTDKSLCVELRNDKVVLKRNHNYYYQVFAFVNFLLCYLKKSKPICAAFGRHFYLCHLFLPSNVYLFNFFVTKIRFEFHKLCRLDFDGTVQYCKWVKPKHGGFF